MKTDRHILYRAGPCEGRQDVRVSHGLALATRLERLGIACGPPKSCFLAHHSI
jgi:hypothetical protein